MSSEAITRNDLTAILNEVLPPTPSEYKKLLWSNPSPTSAMSGNTTIVASGADEYDAIEVVYKTAHIYDGYETALSPFVAGSHITLLAPSGTGGEFSGAIYNAVRTISMVAGGALRVDDAVGMMSSGTTSNNNMCIPYKVYGIKYERVAPPQLEDLTIIESFGAYNNIPATGAWTLPNTKPYKRLFLFFPYWGTYNSTTLASSPVLVDAGQSTVTFTNWTNRAGGVVSNTTISAVVYAIRMEF